MRLQSLVAIVAFVAAGVSLLSPISVRADTVLYDSSGLIQGQQSFVQSFDLTSAGTLTISLSNIAWLDTIQNLNVFLTTSTGVIGNSMSAGTESLNVGPGMVYAHWFGDADGAFGIGAYGIKISFQSSDVTPVPLPPSVVLFLSGLAGLFFWLRSRRHTVVFHSQAV